jgi:hypothetical protein
MKTQLIHNEGIHLIKIYYENKDVYNEDVPDISGVIKAYTM